MTLTLHITPDLEHELKRLPRAELAAQFEASLEAVRAEALANRAALDDIEEVS